MGGLQKLITFLGRFDSYKGVWMDSIIIEPDRYRKDSINSDIMCIITMSVKGEYVLMKLMK
jgi:hypothetical protein